MARMVLARHEEDIFVQCAWADGWGVHSRRATEDMDPATLEHVAALLGIVPDVVRWQLDRHGANVQIGMSKGMDSSPRYNYTISLRATATQHASVLMDWCDTYCTEWRLENDLYEEERAIERIRAHADQREVRLNKLRNRA